MSANVRFVATAVVEGASVLAVIGRKGDLHKAFRYIPGNHSTLLAEAASRCSPGSFAGAAVSTLIQDADSVKQVHLLAIPDAVSRHTCATRPYAISKLVADHVKVSAPPKDSSEPPAKKAKVVRQAQVICVLPEGEALRGGACAMGNAVASVFPLYSRKSAPSDDKVPLDIAVLFVAEDGAIVKDKSILDRVSKSSDGVRYAARLVDAPCSEMNTTALVEEALEQVKDLPHVETEVIRGEELKVRGLGGIYGVGQAAEHPPALCILKYTPPGAKKTLAWCGKGIVYDTGGLSIKGKTFMPGMKRDMGGAAAILAAFRAAIRLEAKDNIYALLCCAENAVGPKATRPDDIHVLYSGKSVEINNTDAEGRLVLGDGVAYAAKHFHPDVLLDMCTLTGAQGISTGQRHAAIMSSDAALEQEAMSAGKRCGNLTFPVPYCPELFSQEFASSVADMKNSVKNRSNAQVSCAGQFIGNHIPSSFKNPWLHVDMAGPVSSGERATGYGVALLLELFI